MGASGAREIDAAWTSLRPTDAPHRHWRWYSIGANAADRFLLRRGALPIAAWAAERPVITLTAARCYRLDYIEVQGDRQGKAIGVFTMASVAARARELDCEGVVLAAFPEVSGFYDALGARRGARGSWRPSDPDLLVYTLDGSAFADLLEVIDEPEER